MGSLEVTDEESRAVQKTPNRVSLESMKAKVKSVEFYRPNVAPHMTVAFVEMENGFIVIGKSAPADPDNFNSELGAKFATEDAMRQIWPLEGYLLCEQLNEG